MGYFLCSCDYAWRSNDSWSDVGQACTKCRLLIVYPYKQTCLDHGDDGRAEKGDYYGGGGKSFGRYECITCQRRWMSAHAWRGHSQKCHGCKSAIEPYWQEILRGKLGGIDDTIGSAPHDEEGCSKCKSLYPAKCWQQPGATSI